MILGESQRCSLFNDLCKHDCSSTGSNFYLGLFIPEPLNATVCQRRSWGNDIGYMFSVFGYTIMPAVFRQIQGSICEAAFQTFHSGSLKPCIHHVCKFKEC